MFATDLSESITFIAEVTKAGVEVTSMVEEGMLVELATSEDQAPIEPIEKTTDVTEVITEATEGIA